MGFFSQPIEQIVKRPVIQGIEEAGRVGIRESLEELAEQQIKNVTPQMFESIFGYAPRQGFKSAAGGLTRGGLTGSLDIGLRRVYKEGGEDGAAQAIKALAKLSREAGLDLSDTQIVNVVAAALKVSVQPAGFRGFILDGMVVALRSADLGDDILNSVAREGTEASLNALVMAPVRGIRNFSKTLYGSFRAGGLSPKNAWKSTRQTMGKINRSRLITYAGGGLAASILLGTGYLIWTGMRSVAPDPNEPNGDEGGDEKADLFLLHPSPDGVRGPEDHEGEEEDDQVGVVDLKDVFEDVAHQEELGEGTDGAPGEVFFEAEF